MGLGTLLTGIALGAAALFLSKKENREKTKRVAKVAVAKAKKVAVVAKKLKADYKNNPVKVKQQLKAKGKQLARKAVIVAKKKVRKLAK